MPPHVLSDFVVQTNWSSKNGGFADGLVTLPRKIKVLVSNDARPWPWTDRIIYLNYLSWPCRCPSRSAVLECVPGWTGKGLPWVFRSLWPDVSTGIVAVTRTTDSHVLFDFPVTVLVFSDCGHRWQIWRGMLQTGCFWLHCSADVSTTGMWRHWNVTLCRRIPLAVLDLECEGSTILRNAVNHSLSHRRGFESSATPLWKPEISHLITKKETNWYLTSSLQRSLDLQALLWNPKVHYRVYKSRRSKYSDWMWSGRSEV